MGGRFTASVDLGLPRIAVDLGYSARSKSCGVAFSDGSVCGAYGFGESLELVLGALESGGRHVLILEAVLSTFHGPSGNPDIRGEFERGRGWYYGPGVTTLAAALRFLSELDRRLPEIGAIPVVEGFLSYKKHRTEHAADAWRLMGEFESAELFVPRAGSEPLSVLIEGVPEVRRYNAPS